MKNLLGGVLLGLLVIASLATGHDAVACGGCFTGPITQSSDSVVTGHRMAFAITPDRTVLWDQIKYTGNPAEFGWVLPISPGAFIEESTDAWFETLEAATAVKVTSPPIKCANASGGGCGFATLGSSSADAKGSAEGVLGGVDVLHEGTVGPYKTATLASADGGALRTWLETHGYVVPPEIEPVIDTYVAEGAQFIALRLIPGQGVSSMTPVRVVTPNGPAMLPLRMVAAGTGSFVDIILYVFGEGRYKLDDFTETHVNLANLSFDFAKNDSNYLTLRADALGQNEGYSFITAFASGAPFGQAPSVYTVNGSGFPAQSLANLYFSQARNNDGQPSYPDPCTTAEANVDSAQLVGTAGGSELPPSVLTCGTYSDIASALTGLHPNKVWLTRLEMTLPHEALGADCKVSLSAGQKTISNALTATKMTNRSAFCPETVFESSFAPSAGANPLTFAWAVGSFGALFFLRRRRDRRR